jgi:hypothetical protein
MATIFHEAFEGRVRFEIETARKLKTLLIEEAIESAVPESRTFAPGSQSAILFANFQSFMSRTVSITFPLVETEISAEDAACVDALNQFWSGYVQLPGEWQGKWEAFADLLDLRAHNAWLGALNAALEDHLAAPPELRGGADDTNPKGSPKSKK